MNYQKKFLYTFIYFLYLKHPEKNKFNFTLKRMNVGGKDISFFFFAQKLIKEKSSFL